MRPLAATLAVLAAGLWLGGLAALFVFAPTVFKAFGPEDRATAGRATSAMFVAFGRYQLAIAGVALIAAFLGYLRRRSNLLVALFVFFAVATVGAVANNALIIPRMEALRVAGESTSPEFRKLHGVSMAVSLAITAAVFVGAVLLPAACRAILAPRRDESLPAGDPAA